MNERVEINDAYFNLAGAVIRQAKNDSKIKGQANKFYRDDAIDFLETNRLEGFIEAFNLQVSPNYIRRSLSRF